MATKKPLDDDELREAKRGEILRSATKMASELREVADMVELEGDNLGAYVAVYLRKGNEALRCEEHHYNISLEKIGVFKVAVLKSVLGAASLKKDLVKILYVLSVLLRRHTSTRLVTALELYILRVAAFVGAVNGVVLLVRWLL